MSEKSLAKRNGNWRKWLQRVRDFAYDGSSASHRVPPGVPRIGLALGGGFARGLAHIGVLKVLVENDIPISGIAGISVGSIVGATFASGASPAEMEEKARLIRWRSFARWTLDRLGLATNLPMRNMLKELLPCSTFEELRVPLRVVATNISNGLPVVFSSGDLIEPLRASCSFPGLFVPVEYQGALLVDGAVVGSVAVDPLRQMGMDRIVAVSLNASNGGHLPTNMFQVIGQAFQIAQNQNVTTWRAGCDVIIEPEVGQFAWDDYARIDELIAAGAAAARRVLPALRALLGPAPAERKRRVALKESHVH